MQLLKEDEVFLSEAMDYFHETNEEQRKMEAWRAERKLTADEQMQVKDLLQREAET